MANYDPTAALAEILAPKNARAQPISELSFHQGVVIAWNNTTGENTVVISGSSINDLAMLNIGDTTNIIVGDTVAVIRYRNSYFIIGRVIVPNTDGFASSAFAYETTSNRVSNFVVPEDVPTTIASASATIPDWANFGIITARVDFCAFNQTGARDSIYAQIDINGSFQGSEFLTDVENNRVAYVGASYSPSIVFTSPGSWTINGQVRTTDAPFSASTLNVVYVSASIFYLRR